MKLLPSASVELISLPVAGFSTLTRPRLVFVDETWASAAMSRHYGRAPKGERLVVAVLRAGRLDAPLVIDRAMNGDLFVAYVEQLLVPALVPGDVVVMDNLSSHKRARVRQVIEAAGCSLLYLPPYSPDLNPIEHAFAKLKSLLRKAQERTVEGLWSFLSRALDLFEPEECRNYIRHCGYAATSTSKSL